MRRLALFVMLVLAVTSYASFAPLSGTFSNVKNTSTGGFTTTMKNKINLVVTINNNGQQFFIQCFQEDMPGFGVVTVLKIPKQIAKINAGPECPASEVQVELDYESANIRTKSGWVYLPRGEIYVPLVGP
jgi:hypothetical protein